MKLFLIAVFSICCIFSHAQTCGSHALMKKGAKLEYMVYAMGFKDSKASKLIFEVADVTDKYSTIIKKGIGIRDAQNDQYTKTLQLQCDGKALLIPFDFYTADTLWFNDGYSYPDKRHVFFTANAPLNDPNAHYSIPLVLDGVTSLPATNKPFKQLTTKAALFSSQAASDWKKLPGESDIYTQDYELVTTIKEVKIGGKEKITTAAGTFDCYIININCDVQAYGLSLVAKISMDYNPKVGLVLATVDQFKNTNEMINTWSIELTHVKN